MMLGVSLGYCLGGECAARPVPRDSEAEDFSAIRDCAGARAFNLRWPESRFRGQSEPLEGALCATPLPSPVPVPEQTTTPSATFTKGATVAWERTFGGEKDDAAEAIVALPDGGVLIAGYTFSNGLGGSDIFLVRIDDQGRELWSRTYGGPEDDVATSLAVLPDGSALLAGYTESYGVGEADMILVKVSGDGEELWRQTYGTPETDFNHAIVARPDGSATLLGYTHSRGGEDAWIVRVDGAGDELSSEVFNGADWDEIYPHVETLDGGEITVEVVWTSQELRTDILVVRRDSEGSLLWSRALGGSANDWGNDIAASPDGGMLVAGFTHSSGVGGSDMYVVKLDPID